MADFWNLLQTRGICTIERAPPGVSFPGSGPAKLRTFRCTICSRVGRGIVYFSRSVCGNSGSSTEPHIHYHLQDTPDFGQGQGMPAQFLDYEADGEVVERGEPVQGQTVSPR